MILHDIRVPIEYDDAVLRKAIRKKKHLPKKFSYKILRRSIDARKKPEITYLISVEIGENSSSQESEKSFIKIPYDFSSPVIIVGAGPAGLFAAKTFSDAGVPVIVLERGKKVEDRIRDVEHFWKTGELNPDSNVQFGEGGAGTFSDGKLNSEAHLGKYSRMILETFVRYGAKESIVWDALPHIGTDKLQEIIPEMRKDLEKRNVTFLFETTVTDFIQKKDGIDLICRNKTKSDTLSASAVIFAIGHSARDTFRMLETKNLKIEPKPFAVGLRIEHPEEEITRQQYGTRKLGAAPYKLTHKAKDGRGVYSFCMCPGGFVVNSSGEEGRLVVNGMSYSGRDSRNSNAAIVVSVSPADFGNRLNGGLEFQEELEEKAFSLCNGKIPVQTVGDFFKNQKTDKLTFSPEIKGDWQFANLREIFPEFLFPSFSEGMEAFAKKIPTFQREDAILSGMETRTSSPLRFVRDSEYKTDLPFVYFAGEGSGYAGGILSSAADGIKTAEAVLTEIRKKNL